MINKSILNTCTMALVLAVFGSNSFGYNGGERNGPGNPAAKNCVALKGSLEQVETPQGQSANCVIDEWILFRAMEQRGLVKPHQYGPIGMPNPASVNCGDIGGSFRVKTTAEGEAGLCVIGAWALFEVIDVIHE